MLLSWELSFWVDVETTICPVPLETDSAMVTSLPSIGLYWLPEKKVCVIVV